MMKTILFPMLIITLLVLGILFGSAPNTHAACAPNTAGLGRVTGSFSVPTSGTYRVWSRIKPDTVPSNNSYTLEIDDDTCNITVGDANIATGTWTWVDYQGGNTSTKTNITLNAGTHSYIMYGRESGVQVDRVVFSADLSCVPVGLGDNCVSVIDTTAPTVSLTAPSNGTTVSGGGSVTASATASDTGGINRVEFYMGSTLKATDTVTPYSAPLSTTGMTAGNYIVSAVAFDNSGNSRTSNTVSITIPLVETGRFNTLPVGAALPAESDCSARVRPTAEIRASINATYNNRRGTGGNYTYPRVTGNYIGTTDEIIQWASCKWGIDEDLLRAQTVQESYWFQNAIGDFNTDGTQCSPVYPIGNYPSQYGGDPAHNGQCPESVGLLQVRWEYHKSGFYSSQQESQATLTNNAIWSTAYNIDYYGAVWRDCFEGNMQWLNTVERGEEYRAGDATGCQGVWFSGRWKTAPAIQYINNIQNYLNSRIWETPGFRTASSANPVLTPDPGPTPDTAPPVVNITFPTENQTVSNTITVSATALDNIAVSGAGVSFYLDGSSTPFSIDSTNPYEATWSTGTVANGTHRIVARASDARGNVGTSATRTFNVSNTVPDTTAPTTAITSPANNSTVSSSVTITATASDGSGIGVARVELIVDGNVVATDTTSPYSFSWNTASYTNTTHTIRTRAYDSANNNSQSSAVSVTVNNVVTPPPNPTPKPGDSNGDNKVNYTDLSIILANWNRAGRSRAQGDLNGDGVVNVFDVSILLANWGR